MRGVSTAVVLLAATVVGCSETVPELTMDERLDQARTQLVADGVTPEVATCVVRLARHDLRIGALDDLTRDELVRSCERAQVVLNGGGGAAPDDSLAFTEGPDTLGDDPTLDALWRSCEEGSGAACDQLFTEAPTGSDYEWFGVSCGDRDEILHCSELDEPAGSEPSR